MHALGAQSVATFPDGPVSGMPMASAPPPPLPQQSGLKGHASGALSDLLGLESELTNIQVSIDESTLSIISHEKSCKKLLCTFHTQVIFFSITSSAFHEHFKELRHH